MRTRRSSIQNLIGAVAALGVAAVLAGPASAQQARTGNIHEDCYLFSLQVSTTKVTMKAACRVSDNNNKMKWSTINLSEDIHSDEANYGHLRWDGSDFQDDCTNISIEKHNDGVLLKATCDYAYCRRTRSQIGPCYSGTTNSTLELKSYYKASSDGTLAVK